MLPLFVPGQLFVGHVAGLLLQLMVTGIRQFFQNLKCRVEVQAHLVLFLSGKHEGISGLSVDGCRHDIGLGRRGSS